jgi:hypothetical protein
VAGIGPKADAESSGRVEREDTVVSSRVKDCAAEVANEADWAEDIYRNERAPPHRGPGGQQGWRQPCQEFILVREMQHSE